jgi:putative ABC transport system permease protein
VLRSYLKIAFKVLLRRKFFTAVSLFGISFTLVVLMVATAIFDHAIAPMAPETRQDRTLGVYFVQIVGESMRLRFTPGFPFFDRYARSLSGVERMSIFSAAAVVNSYLGGARVQSSMKRTDGEFWKILDFSFLEGGAFTTEDVDEARLVAVINATTRRRFFSDATGLGKTLEADGQRFTVVGVVPDVPQLREVPFADIWVPFTTAKTDSWRRDLLMGSFQAIFLARSREDIPLIKEELRARMKTVDLPSTAIPGFLLPRDMRILAVAETPLENAARRIVGALPLGPGVHQRVSQEFFDQETGEVTLARFWATATLLGLLFMLLPTLNLVNLSVSRILERASEIGVRKAFGASSLTLVVQFVVENLALTVVGGAIGFVLSRIVLDGLSASGFLPYAHFSLNGRVFLYALAMAVFFGVLSGAYPAWRMSRLHPVEALRGSTR